MQIKANTLDRLFKRHKEEYVSAVTRVLESGWYVLGKENEKFEDDFSHFLGSRNCVGVNSGLDALCLAVKALGIGIGDEVVVPANTFIATVLAVTNNGATPVFVEPNRYYNIDSDGIEDVITERTKAVMCVHLYGQSCDMEKISSVCQRHGLFLLEDVAQAHGAHYKGRLAGTFGIAGCFSFYPTKNMGAFGDGGAIVTDSDELAERLRALRNYGSKVKYVNQYKGVNSRLDEIQAALLQVKLKYLGEITEERQKLAKQYNEWIENPLVEKPDILEGAEHVFHQYVVRCKHRDKLQEYLKKCDIETQIHYPIPPHLADCYQYLGYKKGDFPITESLADEVLSLPLYNGMNMDEQEYVVEKINRFRIDEC